LHGISGERCHIGVGVIENDSPSLSSSRTSLQSLRYGMFKFGVVRVIAKKSLERMRSVFADDSLFYVNGTSDAYRKRQRHRLRNITDNLKVISRRRVLVTIEATSILHTNDSATFTKRFRSDVASICAFVNSK